MTCQLDAIFAAVAAIAVPYTDAVRGVVTPTAYVPDNLPPTIPSGNLPVRLLLPLGTQPNARSAVAVTFGRGSTIPWTIFDLFLLRPVTQGQLLEHAVGSLVKYTQAYIDAFSTPAARSLIRNSSGAATLESIIADMGIYTYPRDSSTSYFGVEMALSIKEVTA